MYKRVYLVYYIMILIMAFCASTFSQSSVYKQHILSLAPRENLDYNLQLKGLNSARAVFSAASKNDCLELTWDVKIKPQYKFLFNINNKYVSLVDTAMFNCIQFYKKVNQKNITDSFTTRYDINLNRAVTSKGVEWPVAPYSKDLLGMLYDIRTRQLNDGDSIRYVIDVESQSWKLYGIVNPGTGKIAKLPCEHELVFAFTPALPVVKRAWRTDMLTNRISRVNTILTVCIGPAPDHIPLKISFGANGDRVDMVLDKVRLLP